MPGSGPRKPHARVEPVAQRIRIRYAKRGRLRFVSQRDFARALERAVRRAEVPVAHSAGFSPHPKISYIDAAPTGAASEAEYAELSLTRRRDPARLRAGLDRALPDGLDVLDCVEAGPGTLAERIDASRWRIELPGVAAADVAGAVHALLGAGSVQVERVTKSGRRTVDVRAALIAAEMVAAVPPGVAEKRSSGDCAILDVVVRHTTPAVRPDDVLVALRVVAGLVPLGPSRATRLAQGRADDEGRLADPLAPDRAAAVGGQPAAGAR